ncbi:MAG: HU family DNA-binding protein [Prevotella sp.]|nr:HU family DNA-binding protein [Prevotella sp.]
MSVQIRLQQSKFKESNRGGKWHARTVSTGVVTTEDLANAIQENTSFTRGDVHGLVISLIDEISYRLRQGETVVLDGLGRFHLTVESKPVERREDFNIARNITGVKCKFVPAGSRNQRTGKKIQDFATGVRVIWADVEEE